MADAENHNDDPMKKEEEEEVQQEEVASPAAAAAAAGAASVEQEVEFDGCIKSTAMRTTPVNTSATDYEDAMISEQQRRINEGAGAAGANKTASAAVVGAAFGRPSIYGMPLTVDTSGSFPSIGSTLGPFFCLGLLGKGTFSSIHKCINMAYRDVDTTKTSTSNDALASASGGASTTTAQSPATNITAEVPRLAAAKVELSTFAQSGVLDTEATILDFLHRSLPPHTAPVYLGHYRSSSTTALAVAGATTGASSAPPPSPVPPAGEGAAAEGATNTGQAASGGAGAVASALMMEYLPGEDMHQLREHVMQGRTSRRIALEDAITLMADVMLPLLRRMHSVGIIHRDVKPSNCVLRSSSTTSSQVPDFCLVDFGLSKSILVPEDSQYADKEHYFEGKDWLKPQNYNGRACYRKERERAEFRGTSMYASLRVHQLRDYCPRDDMYSLLYVFCDLVSGGLPWMSHAANRDRAMCQTLKERVHGDKDNKDETELLLMGDEYHVARFRRDQQEAAAAAAPAGGDTRPTSSIDLPQPLAMSRDPRRVGLLRRAFQHLSELKFWEQPDYDLIQKCIRGFKMNDRYNPPPVPRIECIVPSKVSESWRSNLLGANRYMPKGSIPEDSDPLDEDVFDDIDNSTAESERSDKDELAVLPVAFRFRAAQMEYHASRPSSVSHQIALRDWMKITLPLLYGEWDTPKYEGGQRTSSDGLKRALYLRVLQKCSAWAKTFGNFQNRNCHYPQLESSSSRPNGGVGKRSTLGSGIAATTGTEEPKRKKRKTGIDTGVGSSYVVLSRALYGLSVAIKDEEAKKPAAQQATRLSFA